MKFRPLHQRNLAQHPLWEKLGPDLRQSVRVVSQVLPFRTNAYVVEELMDWDRLPDDPMFQLTVPQRAMLDPEEFEAVERALEARDRDAPHGPEELQRRVRAIRMGLNPHPSGQLDQNVPSLEGQRLAGIQHKYRETVLFFPAQGQTCHAYCTYCFRWAQFVDLPEMRFQSRETEDLVRYLRAHPEVSDVLVTGGDPLIMKTRVLRRYLEGLLREDLESLRTIRLGTKALAYWPQRFVTDPDADDLLRLFEEIVASGRHLAVMGHYSLPVELSTPVAREAIRRIRATGAQIRMQAPIIRHVNDRADAWAELWSQGVHLGLVPYYAFVERDTGPKHYFELPLVEAHRIFRGAYQQVSGLARSVRGPSMSATPGKVRILGVSEVGDRRVFVLDYLQARDPGLVRQTFFADFDAEATWFDQLRPAFEGDRRFFPHAGGQALPPSDAAPDPTEHLELAVS